MGRLIFIALIILAVWWLVRRIKAGGRQIATRAATKDAGGRVLPCSQCGVYVPERDAVRVGERVFCSSGHLAQFERDRDANG